MPKTAATSGIDAESLAMLEEDVKKGKPRKFALIYKGSQIKALAVFKKGPYNTRIQAAKKSGLRGDTACGMVTGAGVNLILQLPATKEVAKAMGTTGAFMSEPTKVAKLKEFLAEHGLKRKPSYQLVSDPSELSLGGDGPDQSEKAEKAEKAENAPAKKELREKAKQGLERLRQRIQEMAKEMNVQLN